MSTVKEWLRGLSNADTSTDKDSSMMENLLHRVGFPSARVVVGIVYLEGQGPPLDIHSTARMIIDMVGGN